MAMTKADQQRLASAERQAAINRALRWSDVTSIEPDVPVPQGFTHTQGFTFNEYAAEVRAAWSESVSHGSGEWQPYSNRRSASQRGIPLYSTRTLALRALRCALEQKYAVMLESIDREIAMEETP